MRLIVYVKALALLTALADVDEKRKRSLTCYCALNLLCLVVVTLGLYWSLLESGLALIAACLPTLSSLFIKTGGLTTVIRSIRSVFSLRSTGRSVNSDEGQPVYLQPTNSSGKVDKPIEAKLSDTTYDVERV